MVTGIDVSHHQGRVDWSRVAADGHRFAFCKATQGVTFVDPEFEHNWKGIRYAGLVRGAYHYATARLSIVSQAQHFLCTVGELGDGDLGLVLDIEDGKARQFTRIGHHATSVFALAFLAHLHRETDRTPIVYSGTSFARRLLRFDLLREYPLWQAQYTRKMAPDLLPVWPWTFWQHSATGRVGGITKPVDLNRFVGDESALRKMGACQ